MPQTSTSLLKLMKLFGYVPLHSSLSLDATSNPSVEKGFGAFSILKKLEGN